MTIGDRLEAGERILIFNENTGNIRSVSYDDAFVQPIENSVQNITNDLDHRVSSVHNELRAFKTPEGVFSTISQTHQGGFPVFPLVGGQYRPNNTDYHCNDSAGCPASYTCMIRSGDMIGRCYQLHWNRAH